ncbi:MAG: glycosyltransferase family 2 protein [Candidatus Doudnabacteria bacterium]|nr:glycosyltransferase family 2 protein [Candidatus Doudnabacteria bacterium]
MKKLSVIIPAFNEERRIGKTLEDIGQYLERQAYDYEIIVVDNNSRDHTARVVKELESSSVKNARIVEEWSKGKGAAVQRGVSEAVGEYIVFMDADNATPISEIEKFWPALEAGIEVVIGDRYLDPAHKSHQPWFRTMLSRLSNYLIQIVLVPHIHDTQAGFKAFKADSARQIFRNLTIHGWAFDMELLAIALKFSYRIKAVPIIRNDPGESTVPPTAFLESLRDLFIIKWRALTGKYSPFNHQD